MSRKRPNITARLLRSRAVSVCLGRRSWYLKPLDRSPGRPSLRESLILSGFRKPVWSFDPALYEDQGNDEMACAALIDSCDSYLHAVGLDRGWFEVVERAQLLGSHVSIRVRTFDVFVQRASLLEKQLGDIRFVKDRKNFAEDRRVAYG